MTLEQAEALFVADSLPGECLPDLAVSLLESGIDCPALRQLAGLTKPTLRDAGEVFERMIRELRRTLPTRDEATWRLAKALAASVLSGETSFREAARQGAKLAIAFAYAEQFMPFYLADDEYELPFHKAADIDAWLNEHCEALMRNETVVPRRLTRP
jgi:hypothetical protein